MDIQDLGGSKLEQTYAPNDNVQDCPGCTSQVSSGDRFCQECGTRIGTNRSRRASIKSKSDLKQVEPGSASIICINCGTTNKALSTLCCDCKIPLIPTQRRREDSPSAEQSGLRGSLTNRRKTRGANLDPPPHTLCPTGASAPTVQEVFPTVRQTSDSVSHEVDKECQIQTFLDTEVTAQNALVSPPLAGKTRVKQRLPGFISPLFKTQTYGNSDSNVSKEGAALDFLFADSVKPSVSPFEKLISDTKSMGGYFSISTAQYYVECFFERIPLPLLFLLLSLVIVGVTATATTHWNRYEQRLKAIDKIAINNEEKMREFRLDEVINTMQELEKTEKGDLPPRARAVLDQSLWLRSYSFAKQHEYAKAISDLSFVTANFISYEDVVEKLAEYKKLLAKHPEFASPTKSAPQVKPRSGDKNVDTKKESKFVVASQSKKLKEKDSRSTALELTLPKDDHKKSAVVKNSEPLDNGKKQSSKSEAVHLDRDMKRSSNLLVEYFSKPESNQSDHVTEPPSYEEWTKGGKRDF